MDKGSNVPIPYYLVDFNGLEELRALHKDIHSAMTMIHQKMTQMKEAIPPEKKLFTLAEAAKYLAISESFLRKDCSEGPRKNRTPGPDPIKVGDMVRYTREDLDEWIAKHRKQRAHLT